MKVLALIQVVPNASMDALRGELLHELKASWELFASGVLRETYATASPTRVVFVLETADLAQAHDVLQKMPLIAAGLLSFELVELRPFVNWSMLFAR